MVVVLHVGLCQFSLYRFLHPLHLSLGCQCLCYTQTWLSIILSRLIRWNVVGGAIQTVCREKYDICNQTRDITTTYIEYGVYYL